MRDWLVGIFGEAYAVPAFWTIILVAVAILLWVVLRVSRRLTSGTFVSGGRGRQPRLAVTDATPVDNHRRLVLVRRDNVEHLLLIGGTTDLVIEAGIGAPPPAGPRGSPERPEPALSRPPEASRPARQPGAARSVAPAPTAPQEQPRPRPEQPAEPRLPAEPSIQIADAAPVSTPPERRPAPAPVEPRIMPQPAPPPVTATTATVAAPVVAAAGFAASRPVEDPAPHAPEGSLTEETVDGLSEALDDHVSQERAKADPSLEDEMSKLLEELSDERK